MFLLHPQPFFLPNIPSFHLFSSSFANLLSIRLSIHIPSSFRPIHISFIFFFTTTSHSPVYYYNTILYTTTKPSATTPDRIQTEETPQHSTTTPFSDTTTRDHTIPNHHTAPHHTKPDTTVSASTSAAAQPQQHRSISRHTTPPDQTRPDQGQGRAGQRDTSALTYSLSCSHSCCSCSVIFIPTSVPRLPTNSTHTHTSRTCNLAHIHTDFHS